MTSGLVQVGRGVLWCAARVARRPFAALGEWILVLASDCRAVEGVAVGARGENRKALMSRVGESLALAREVDPRRYGRIQRNVKRVIVAPVKMASYLHELGICLLSEDAVANRSTAVVAAGMIHEATHARLERRGIRYWPKAKDRIEALCYSEQAAFARRLVRKEYPGAERLADYWMDLARRYGDTAQC